MKGFGKFLFGGLLGAAIGYLASPKRAQRVRDALLGKDGVRGLAPPPQAATPSLYAPPVAEEAFPPPVSVEAEPIVAEAPVFVEPEPVVELEPIAEPEIIAQLAAEPEAALGAETEPEPELIAEAPLVSEVALVAEPEVAAESGEPYERVHQVPMMEEESLPAAQVEEEIQPAEEIAVAPLDLRARIEETRRRIQQELERPFVTETPEDQVSSPSGSPWEGAPLVAEDPAVPDEATAVPAEAAPDWASAPPAEPTPVAPAWVAPDWPAAPSDETYAVEPPMELIEPVAESVAPSVEPFEPVAEMPAVITEMTGVDQAPEADSVSDEAGEFDREAMRRRIEATRNRLKAKAFDAMLSGESSLLARDAAGALEGSARNANVPVDSEVDETIESTLTEEDL